MSMARRGKFQVTVRQCLRAWFTDVPHQTEPAHRADEIIANVDLPPEKALIGRTLVVMVIVVPPFTQRQQRQEKVVSAIIIRSVAALAEQVTQRVDGKGGVIKQHRADNKTPYHGAGGAGPAAGEVTDQQTDASQEQPRQPVQAIQPTQFRIARPIADVFPGGLRVFLGQNPSQMRPPKTGDVWRVRILRGIRVAMMPPRSEE